uniref:Ig-like domain-containing protein n=1 Tax=Strigamia maritima TaxID=126957 RepID=T1JDK8_STRMM
MDLAKHLTAVIMAALLINVHGCPNNCSCRWKSGKETVDCARKGIQKIPDGIASGTQVLNVSGNPLVTVPSQAFLQAGLLNLQRIYLSRCNLKQVSEFAFAQLTNLIDLDIGYNSLVSVPSKSFTECPALRRLVLSGNPIAKLEANAFTRLSFLTVLEISHCQIRVVAPRAFDGLTALTHLKLDGNQLTTLKGGVVVALVSLHGAALQGNPWRCDCALREMRVWLVKGRVPCPIPPVCEQPPRVRGIPLDRVDLTELACEPRGNSEQTMSVFVGSDAAISCRTSAVPEAQVRWAKAGRVLVNWTSTSTSVVSGRRYLIVENGTTDKTSTLVIPAVQNADAGVYTCRANNRAGEWSAGTNLHVLHVSLAASKLNRHQIVALIAGILIVVVLLLLIGVLVGRRRKSLVKSVSSKDKNVNGVSYSGDNNCHSKMIRRTLLSNCTSYESADCQAYAKSFLDNTLLSRPDVVNVQTENESLTISLTPAETNNKWPPSIATGNRASEEKRPSRYALLTTFQSSDDLLCDQFEASFVSGPDKLLKTDAWDQ